MKKIGLVIVAVELVMIGLLFIPRTITVKKEPPIQLPKTISRSAPILHNEIAQMIKEAAVRYNINVTRFLETAKCESSLRPKIVGDDGESYGLWQIHLKSHPTVKIEQAFDPIWATEWAAVKFKENPTIWTCYRNLYL